MNQSRDVFLEPTAMDSQLAQVSRRIRGVVGRRVDKVIERGPRNPEPAFQSRNTTHRRLGQPFGQGDLDQFFFTGVGDGSDRIADAQRGRIRQLEGLPRGGGITAKCRNRIDDKITRNQIDGVAIRIPEAGQQRVSPLSQQPLHHEVGPVEFLGLPGATVSHHDCRSEDGCGEALLHGFSAVCLEDS